MLYSDYLTGAEDSHLQLACGTRALGNGVEDRDIRGYARRALEGVRALDQGKADSGTSIESRDSDRLAHIAHGLTDSDVVGAIAIESSGKGVEICGRRHRVHCVTDLSQGASSLDKGNRVRSGGDGAGKGLSKRLSKTTLSRGHLLYFGMREKF